MSDIVYTLSRQNIYTDALPRICRARNCLNSAEKNENYCTACIESKGLVRGLRTPTTYRRKVTNFKQRLSGYLKDCATIYCIQMGEDGPIKIGRTQNVFARIDELQTANPYKLTILAELLLPFQVEYQIHDYLKDFRMMGEWFEPTPQVMEVVDLIQCSDLDGLLSKFEAQLVSADVIK